MLHRAKYIKQHLDVMPEVQRDKEAIKRNELNMQVVKGNYWPSLVFSAGAGSGYSGKNLC